MKLEKVSALIDAAVENMEDEMVGFLQELVRIPTENPPGLEYTRCAEAIGNHMAAMGLEVEYVRTPDERLPQPAPHGRNLPRVSVLGRRRGGGERPVLHFSGHYDVVPAGTGWTVDPYAGVVKDGKVFGRGAADQKSGLVAQIYAVRALHKAGLRLKGTVVLSATPDEETGGRAGMGYLVEQGYLNAGNTDYCVITECLGVDTLCLGHRGTLWFEITTWGKQCHGGMPGEGINAIDNMLKLIYALRAEIGPQLEMESAYPIIPAACRKSTLTVTMLNAGTKVNIVPDRCTAAFDWRLIPEQSVSRARDTILHLCERLQKEDPRFRYEFRLLQQAAPTIVPGDTPLVKAFLAAGEIYLHKPPVFSVSPGCDDQRFVVNQGRLQQCIVYGPGPLAAAHQSDEYIPIHNLKLGTKIMALAAVKLLGLEDEPAS